MENEYTLKKSFVIATVAMLSVGACQPTTENYLFRKGGSVAQTDKDYFECELAASRGVPQDTRIATTPVYTNPVQTNCYQVGYSVQCNTTGGQVYGGNTYTYDANSKLRATYFARCLASRGYQVVELPRCDSSKVPPELLQALAGKQRLPKEGACYIALTERAGNIVYNSELIE